MRRILVALFAAGSMLAAGTSRADEPVTLNFVNADIEAVATAIGKIVNRNFLIDPRVKGTVNLVSARPVPTSAVYGIFLSALRLQGFTAVESGRVTKILPEADAKHHLRGVQSGSTTQGDRLLTEVFTLRYASAAQLLPVLRPIITPNNPVAVFAGTNSIVVTDYADNLVRIAQIIDAVDQPGGGEPHVIPLSYASADDIAQTINRVLADTVVGAGAPAGAVETTGRVFVAADARTNSLIVRSENPARLAYVQNLVQRLDTHTGATGNVHVVYLKNAEAKQVAQTLQAVLAGEGSAGPAGATTSPVRQASAPGRAQGTGAAVAGGGGVVHADTASNALLISAPNAVFAQIRDLVEKLDVRRPQVFVEALVVEVQADKAAEFGIQWQSIGDLSSPATRGIGGTNFGAPGGGANIISAAANLTSLGPGLNIGVVKGQITIPGVGTVTNLAALARALESTQNANILSIPNLLTLDNEEARIVIGQNVPFITGQYAQTGSTTTPTPFQTIERRDVGLTLRVKPQITEGASVKLQIYQEVSSVRDSTNAAGVITNKRAIDSTVLVDDGQIVAIGGLVEDSTSVVVEKVPVLGDIPVLGHLFRYETRKQTKTNLMVFLRPIVMRDALAYGGVTTERYRRMLGDQEKSDPPSHPVLPDLEGPRLPPLDQGRSGLPVQPAVPELKGPQAPPQDQQKSDSPARPVPPDSKGPQLPPLYISAP